MCGALAIAAPAAALPAASQDLRLSPAQAQWFAAGYQLSAGPLQLGAGRLADRIGPRRVLLAALAVFTAGTLWAAVAGGAPGLIGARLLQGTGGAVLSPVSLTLLLALHRTSGNETRAVAGWVSTAAVASCLGPLLGGSLTTALGWRGVFGALAVLAAVTVCGALALPVARTPLMSRTPLDITGIALCTGAAAAILIAVTGPAALTTVSGPAAAVLLLLLVRRTRRHPHAALDARLLRHSPAHRALWGLLTLFTANSAFTFLTYFYLAHAHALGPFRATLLTLPATLPAVLTGRLAAAGTARGHGRRLLRAGLLCVAAGLLTATSGFGRPTPLWLLCGAYVLVGCGLGLANGAAMATVTARHRTAGATATATTFAMLGGASGPVVAGAVLLAADRLPFVRGTPPGPPGTARGAGHASWPIAEQHLTAGIHASLAVLALTTATAALALTRRVHAPCPDGLESG
ncbi:MFS transporter [Streptomyces sp. ISL-11]|uniref:MFS transporter n=1 Tax=Streptomyces sp. ISL-11 TaxID=2819174 RepID=UPI001BE5FF22|nr:MFS transporter [Streptomyces sp. ISL-11]MBT2383604.1 MFS transporter [Streptomyces sp. ISL-11]